MVLLPGLACSKESFEGAWECDALAGYSLLAFDFPGFGASDKPEGFFYGLEDHAKVCEAVIRSFPGQEVHIVGHSMGAAIGLLLSDTFLVSIRSFVNAEGNLIGDDCSLMSRAAINVSYETFGQKIYQDLAVRFDKYCNWAATSPRAFYLSAQSLVAWSDSGSLLERFRSLGCRKAYFYGERSSGIQVLEHLADIERREIGASGHFMMQDNATDFYRGVAQFVRKEPSQGG